MWPHLSLRKGKTVNPQTDSREATTSLPHPGLNKPKVSMFVSKEACSPKRLGHWMESVVSTPAPGKNTAGLRQHLWECW